MSALTARLGALVANDDPLAEIASTVALAVAASQPTYPLYLHAIAGAAAAPAWATLLSTPFFLMVPFVALRSSLAARALLPLAGAANTLIGLWALGPGVGVALFFLPCLWLAVQLFRPGEWRVSLACGVAVAAAYWLAGDGAPHFSAVVAASMTRLNAISVAALFIIGGRLFARRL